MDRYTKIILTVIAIALISIAVKDVDLFPIAEAQQGWEIDNELAMNGSMQALPEQAGYAYICQSTLYSHSSSYGDHGYLVIHFYTAPQCVGSYVGGAYMFSDGATHVATHGTFLFSENQMLSYFESANNAADSGQRVRYHRCSSSKDSCLRAISFRGDPADVDDAD